MIEQPIHILNVFTDQIKPYFVTPRVLFVGEMYSKATIIEEHIGLSSNAYLNVPVNELRLYSGAMYTMRVFNVIVKMHHTFLDRLLC